MRIVVVGSGYVGLVTGACLAHVGHDVVCIDKDASKIDRLRQGVIPIYEPGLESLVQADVKAGRLAFDTDLKACLQAPRDAIFIAVGTPPGEDGSADLSHVLAVAAEIGASLQYPAVVVDKSTVPVGTADRVRATIQAVMDTRAVPVAYHVVSNPEFLKEGAALDDFLHPARVVVGADNKDALDVMEALYAPFTQAPSRFLAMKVRDAEMTKYAANAMLATRISFMNELAQLCDRLGVDIDNVRTGISTDPRIGAQFLSAGVGYGGSCFPKDVKALVHTGQENGVAMEVLQAVEALNDRQKHYLVHKTQLALGNLRGKRVALWGLAFKAGTDDMREAPSLTIIADLLAAGATVVAYDPVAQETALHAFDLEGIPASSVEMVSSKEAALVGADILAVVTEWPEFRAPDYAAVAAALHDKMVFDGRNLYEAAHWARVGVAMVGIGR